MGGRWQEPNQHVRLRVIKPMKVYAYCSVLPTGEIERGEVWSVNSNPVILYIGKCGVYCHYSRTDPSRRFQQSFDYRQLSAHLESLAGMFTRVSRDQFRELAAQVHNCAGKLPYVDDCDYGALVLESVSDIAATAELRVEVQLKPECSGGIFEWEME